MMSGKTKKQNHLTKARNSTVRGTQISSLVNLSPRLLRRATTQLPFLLALLGPTSLGGFASHGEPARLAKNELWLGGTRYLPEAVVAREMERRYRFSS
jgi:hypothetical protein